MFPLQKYTSWNAFSFPRKWILESGQTSVLVRCCFSCLVAAFYTHNSESFCIPWRYLCALDRKENLFLWNNCMKCLCFTLNHQSHAFWIIEVRNKNSIHFFSTTTCPIEKNPMVSCYLQPSFWVTQLWVTWRCSQLFSPFTRCFLMAGHWSTSQLINYLNKSTCSLRKIPGFLEYSSS